MEVPDGVLIFVVAGSVGFVTMLIWRDAREAFIEAMNNFRGGPPTPMHPSPADDGRLLRRRARKAGD